MKAGSKRSVSFIFLTLFFGVIIGTILSMLLGAILPGGVVREFFLTTTSIGWGITPNNWTDMFIFRFKTGLFLDISVTSILGLGVAWYFLRYFK
ncbi:MAG: hypothetical protein QGF36_04970 [Candidatus Marinimicrobia bacterium]|nr:hypothetical protein [Candidatus Neomarinimicrobiota bacterium]MDP6853372.1 hypothetical protein [Candidatus Neomarinimicrobiota bacterium]MDP6936765.1 hypothetical protein [Candidatus Neomarinimicrobiota bacterium]